MASTSDQLSALGNDGNFRARVMVLALQYAVGTVYIEDPATPNHALRLNYARSLVAGGGSNIPIVIANSTNIIAGNTTYDFTTGHVKTDVTDTAISSQLATDWNMLAGV